MDFFCNFRSSARTTFDKNLEVSLKDKVYPKTYYHHLGSSAHNKTPTKI